MISDQQIMSLYSNIAICVPTIMTFEYNIMIYDPKIMICYSKIMIFVSKIMIFIMIIAIDSLSFPNVYHFQAMQSIAARHRSVAQLCLVAQLFCAQLCLVAAARTC